MKEQWNQFRALLQTAGPAVFFGGAGVSTESGIPDFRSTDGLYSQTYSHPPETMVSHSFLSRWPEEFFRFYRDKMVYPDAAPNPAHQKLAEWERSGWLSAVITQNIDGLHQAAGSREVLELHGSIHRNHCVKCGKKYPLAAMLGTEPVPVCPCGGMIRPDVVLYEETLDENVLRRAVAHIRAADVLIIGGTSLVVYPAAGLTSHFRGRHLVVVNKSPTPQDRRATLLIQDPIGEVFGAM